MQQTASRSGTNHHGYNIISTFSLNQHSHKYKKKKKEKDTPFGRHVDWFIQVMKLGERELDNIYYLLLCCLELKDRFPSHL